MRQCRAARTGKINFVDSIARLVQNQEHSVLSGIGL